jgi:cytochrome b involved in lipid metabolism
MAVVSVRFNSKEEKILRTLKKYFNCDSSNLIKRSLLELYEDIHDKEIIEEFEVKEDTSKIKFIGIDDLLNS